MGQNAFLLVIYLIIAIIARILAFITRADFNVKIGLAGVGFAVTAFAFSLGFSVKTDSEIRKLRKKYFIQLPHTFGHQGRDPPAERRWKKGFEWFLGYYDDSPLF